MRELDARGNGCPIQKSKHLHSKNTNTNNFEKNLPSGEVGLGPPEKGGRRTRSTSREVLEIGNRVFLSTSLMALRHDPGDLCLP